MSLDEALSAVSEALFSGEATSAADQLAALSALAEKLRESESNLRESQYQLHESQDQLRESEGLLRESQDQLHESQGLLRESQDQLHESEGLLRESESNLHESQDQLHESQDLAQAMSEEIEQLHRALKSRDIIGQAKGMLMERFNVDAAAAFKLLVKLSQSSNTPLTLVAQKLVELDHPSVKPNG